MVHYTGISRALQSRGGIHLQRNRTSLQSHDQPELSVGETPHPKNTLNDMSGDRFLYFTKSVLSTSYPSLYSHELRKNHGANKPPSLWLCSSNSSQKQACRNFFLFVP